MSNIIKWTWTQVLEDRTHGKKMSIDLAIECKKCYQELKSKKADDSFTPNHKCDSQWKFGKVKEI